MIVKNYFLTFYDGNKCFNFTGGSEVRQWIDEFATILGLTSNESEKNCLKVIFGKQFSKAASSRSVNATYGKRKRLSPINFNDICIWRHDETLQLFCEIDQNYIADNKAKYLSMALALKPVYDRAIEVKGLPLHTGLAEWHGNGALFAGRGGIGKSTCIKRLPAHWKQLSDDEAVVMINENRDYLAHPLPTWSDYLWGNSTKTWDVQYAVPLRAVFFLEQAEKDKLTPIGKGQAAALLNNAAFQVYHKYWINTAPKQQDRQTRIAMFNNACRMAGQIPAYILSVSKEGRFWELVEDVIS